MAKAKVAIVGRPNVGKSTLFNRIVGDRISIVEDTPGVTRDRIYADANWSGVDFTMIDTGGIEPDSKEEMLSKMRTQAQVAIESADVIIFLVNVRDGLTTSDYEVCRILQKAKKPVVLAVNKLDTPGMPPVEFYEFYNLGLGDPVGISSIHGMGLGDLLDEVVKNFPENLEEDIDEDIIKVAVIGRPNAGKSSLINKILGEERVIVSPVAGTTRDAVDTYYEVGDKKFMFIDTAGLRRKSKVDENIERYSIIRSLNAIERCDVCVIIIDTNEGITEQDSKVAGFAHEAGKGVIIVANKWDLVSKETNTMKEHTNLIYEELSFMQYAPVCFISALTGQRVDKVFSMINSAYQQNAMRISTGTLNDIINDAIGRVQPPSDKGKRLKIYYATQVSTKPPTFVIFANSKELFHFSYQRYLENKIRDAFGLAGTPIRIIIREKNENDTK